MFCPFKLTLDATIHPWTRDVAGNISITNIQDTGVQVRTQPAVHVRSFIPAVSTPRLRGGALLVVQLPSRSI